ncbi:hypothetical protein DPMN_172952 [Dreissena polymorpha]|uniref:Uncharacterized protein n=1 Tax=Dreissena polymorpha TaxID=45954 RepID=A0A9D4E397_DREPO|nr:hypothetical protein DPMN_172952 [Dreissena polymorpha]
MARGTIGPRGQIVLTLVREGRGRELEFACMGLTLPVVYRVREAHWSCRNVG